MDTFIPPFFEQYSDRFEVPFPERRIDREPSYLFSHDNAELLKGDPRVRLKPRERRERPQRRPVGNQVCQSVGCPCGLEALRAPPGGAACSAQGIIKCSLGVW